MKPRGGYNIALDGRPVRQVEALPEPEVLHLPVTSRRLTFSNMRVSEGDRVAPGQILAEDPDNYSVPLLAPRAGTVRLDTTEGHITLEGVEHVPEEAYHPDEDAEHVPKGIDGSAGMKRLKLRALGAWQFFQDAHTGELPDPMAIPQAVIVSTVSMDRFSARGDVQIHKRLSSFTRGLEHIQSLLEYQSNHLVLPDVHSEFAERVQETLRGYAWVELVEVPLTYPYGHFALAARSLGLKRDPEHPVWGVDTAGVLATDRALTMSRPSTVRIVSLGGPGISNPLHVKAMPGYPLGQVLGTRVSQTPVRLINGGVLAGVACGRNSVGIPLSG